MSVSKENLTPRTENEAVIHPPNLQSTFMNGFQGGNVESFQIICDHCKKAQNINSVQLVSNRPDLETFLQSTLTGLVILNYYQKNQSIPDYIATYLSRLIIDREIFNIIKREKISLENPLLTLS